MGKINSLEDASQEEIERHNDVCAICYQEMSVAKVTKCKHMFHSICLRKWLYMQVRGWRYMCIYHQLTSCLQDNCPMCHEKLYLSKDTDHSEADGQQEEELEDSDEDTDTDVTADFSDSDEDDQR